MIDAAQIDARRQEVAASPDLAASLDRLTEAAQPLLERMPIIPKMKALLSADGGICETDGAALVFDPWSPTVHRCSRCGREHTGARHEGAWAHHQHLWIAERIAHLATVAVMGEHAAAGARAEALLVHYGRHYLDYPNADNVLGPGRLFFSTYLESIWMTNYLAGAVLLREAGILSDEAIEAVSTVADEAANLIGEFDEGLSNRQTWHNAALAAIGVWFEDGELVHGVLERGTGVIAHLVQGFGRDGMWYEGENYHLFALRGQLVAMGWAKLAGAGLLEDKRLAGVLEAALYAPAVTALPDFTFPARKDSRFGVSLAQPMYLESWEIGLARLGSEDASLWTWLRELYASPAPAAQRFDSYLHEAGKPAPTAPRTRVDLSWWALLEMRPLLPEGTGSWTPASVLLEDQGLAILRRGRRYVSLESGTYGGGHGHPDRLHLTLHADGVYWLPDPGTGSYVARDLFWYRSTLAHNAPRLDGVSQTPGDAVCEFFDASDDWSWVRGRYGDLIRTTVAGPRYLLDIVELAGSEERVLELPWHLAGQSEVLTPGTWVPDAVTSDFVREAARFEPAGVSDDPYVIRSASEMSGNKVSLTMHVHGKAELLRASAPGLPGTDEPATFYLLRARGRNLRWITVLESSAAEPVVRSLRVSGDLIEVDTADGVHQHTAVVDGWDVAMPTPSVKLRGKQAPPPQLLTPLFKPRHEPVEGVAVYLAEPPALDGTLAGFVEEHALLLDYEDQYRRSEEPYAGPEEFAATAYVNWMDDTLFLGVDVCKAEVVVRPDDAPPLRLDNEPDDIHSDGVQVYWRLSDDVPAHGCLIVPSARDGSVRARPVAGGTDAEPLRHGAWRRTETGYCLTVALAIPELADLRAGDRFGFDLLVNRMEPGRLRRAGQLVWSGGGGWVWLQGDRQDPARFGALVLQ